MNHFSDRCRLFCFFIWMIAVLPAIAQQPGFIHLQSENNLPYNVQWNGTTLSSSANGYLVIPQVKMGQHTLVISFAPEISAPYTFTLAMGDKPRGFSIRQAVDNTWRLFDLIDYSLVAGKAVPKENKTVLAEEPIAPPAQEPAIVKTKDTSPVISKVPAVVKVQRPSVEIKKIFDRESTSGIDQVYVITKSNRSDTIALFIPVLNEHTPGQLARLLYMPGVETVVPVPVNNNMVVNTRNRNKPSSK
ncbi:MAG: hypothetical protein V4450_16595 [Bacteroidota bacterium]